MSDKISSEETPDVGLDGSLHRAQHAIEQLLASEDEQTDDFDETTDNESSDEELDGEAYDDADDEDTDEDFDADEDDADIVEDDDSDDDESESEASVFTVKVDGEEIEVDQEELIAGYSRQRSFTKKSQQLAEERKAFEVDRDAVLLERQQYTQLLGALQTQLVAFDEPAPDFDRMYDEDPIEANRAERLFRKKQEERQAKLQAIAQEQQRVELANAEEQNQHMRGLIQQEVGRLPDVIPEWKDESTAAKQREELRNYLIDQGVAEEELGALVRADHIKVLRKAMLYDQGQRRVSKAKKQGRQTGTVKAGSRPTSKPSARKTKAARQRFAKSGRLDDAAALIEQLL